MLTRRLGDVSLVCWYSYGARATGVFLVLLVRGTRTAETVVSVGPRCARNCSPLRPRVDLLGKEALLVVLDVLKKTVCTVSCRVVGELLSGLFG